MDIPDLDIDLIDSIDPVKPCGWFLVTLNVINEATCRIRDRTITRLRYDPSEGRLVGE